jgi:transcription initiation factor TFIID subunit 7
LRGIIFAKKKKKKEMSEEQIVLRLPVPLADQLRSSLAQNSLAENAIQVVPNIDPANPRKCKFVFEGVEYPAKLCDLPCIVEVQKTFDRAAYYKSGDICQILVVYNEGDEEPDELMNDGLTPPTTSIREKRFRKKKFTVRIGIYFRGGDF